MTPLPSVKEFMQKHDLMPKKRLGQNFILDSNITNKIASFAGNLSEKTVIEIGPGPGGLTRSILDAGAKEVFAIELDKRCFAALAEVQEHYIPRLKLYNADAKQMDITRLGSRPRVIIANLPYNVATELLIGWLQKINHIDMMILMFQREVADRITGADSGRLAIMCNWLCRTERVYDLPPGAFVPPPKVHSAVVKFTPLSDAPEKLVFWKDMEYMTQMAFGQRRKMLRSSLNPKFHGETIPILEYLGIDPTLRAENLTVEEYFRIARFTSKHG